MGFVALRFDATAADRWADALLEAGALSVDAADPCAGTPAEAALYGEPGQADLAAWPVSRITALFPTGTDLARALANAGITVGEPLPMHVIEPVADEDWVRLTQAQFAPIRIADRLWIVPSWCEPVDPGAINLKLDPGLAFGSGSHPTTRLCLRWLIDHLRGGESVLDYGCGSGILALAAARLGAGPVAGIDIDAQAVMASRANAARNGVIAKFSLPNASPAAKVDVVVANILANPLQLLAPLLASRVNGGGKIVLSGILEPQADAVAATYARWFNIAVWGRDDGWVALAGVRNAR